MFNFNDVVKTSDVKKKVREIAFSNLVESFSTLYGAENVSIIDNSEIAVCCGTRKLIDGTEGEVCFTVKPVAKDFDFRTAESGKIFYPFERLSEADAYEVSKTEKERKAEEKAKEKAEKKRKEEEARKAKQS